MQSLFEFALKALGDFQNPSHLAIAFTKNHVVELQRSGIVNTDLFLQFSEVVNWEFVSRYIAMSEDMIRRLADFVDWELIYEYQTLTEEFMTEHSHRVPIDLIFIYSRGWSEKSLIDLYTANKSSRRLYYLLKYQPHVSERAILDNIALRELQYQSSSLLHINRSYSDEFVSKVFSRTEFNHGCADSIILSPSQIEAAAPDWNIDEWKDVMKNNKIPKNILVKCKSHIDWAMVLATQDLDEEILNIYADRMFGEPCHRFSTFARDLNRLEMFPEIWHAEAVSLRDDLTPEFCIENMHRLDFAVLRCRNFPHEFFETFRDQLSDTVIARYAPQTYIEAHPPHGGIVDNFERFSLRFIFDLMQ